MAPYFTHISTARQHLCLATRDSWSVQRLLDIFSHFFCIVIGPALAYAASGAFFRPGAGEDYAARKGSKRALQAVLPVLQSYAPL